MGKLLLLLENSVSGCHITGLVAYTNAYAHDLIIILSVSVHHFQLMLDVYVDFREGCDILFVYCNKSQFMQFNEKTFV